MTGTIAGFGRVWDIQQHKVLYSVQHQDNDEGGIIAAEFSADNRYLVTMEQQSIARWEVDDGRLLGYWQWPDLRALAISASGRSMSLQGPHHSAQKSTSVGVSDEMTSWNV